MSTGDLSPRDLLARRAVNRRPAICATAPQRALDWLVDLRISEVVEVRNFVFYGNCIPRRSKVLYCESAEILKKICFATLDEREEWGKARCHALIHVLQRVQTTPPEQAPDHCQVEHLPIMTALSTWQGRVRLCYHADPAPVTNCKQKTIRQVLVTQIY